MGVRAILASMILVFGLTGGGIYILSVLYAQAPRSECRYDDEQEVSLAASAADNLELRAGSGHLKVEGRQGLDQVRVMAYKCASDLAYVDELQVTLERVAEEIVLETHYPNFFGFSFGNRVARIDLVVQIPRDMAVKIDDSSGSMEVSGTGALRIDDSSGSVEVRDISSSVSIDDSSGEIEVEDVAGDLEIDDGSGSIHVRDIEGTLRVSDNSGSIDVVDVGQDVIVDRDGSGSIQVRGVLGDFTVHRDGSGGIRYSNVKGRVDIPQQRKRGSVERH